MDSVDISVVVPTWNSAPYVRATLATVAAQTVRPRELIVSDDGSVDATREIVAAFLAEQRELPARILPNPHRGPGAARNAAVAAATAEWIAFLDSDDLWAPEKLRTVQAAIRAHPEANLFCHNETVRKLDGTEARTNYACGFAAERPLVAQLYRRNYFSTSAVVCRRSLVLESGGFDSGLSSAQDYDLWLKMAPRTVPCFIPEVLGTYVLRSGNISTTRFWKRLGNLLRVKYRHRAQVASGLYYYCVARAVASHLFFPLRGGVARLRQRYLVR